MIWLFYLTQRGLNVTYSFIKSFFEFSADERRCISALNSILAHNLQTEFKEEFYKRVHHIGAMPRQFTYSIP
jgi:hypothetical protein